MEKSTKHQKKKLSKASIIVGTVAITAAGILIVPPLMIKISNHLYKNSLKDEPIDFDNLGPEIQKKPTDNEEKE